MREAIGGAWLYYIFVVMIIFIVSFLAVFLSYMSAYRASNHAVSMIEQSEGAITKADLNKMNPDSFDYEDMNWCYIRPQGSNGYIVRVTAYLHFTIPLVDLPVRIGVKNETRTINCYGKSETECPGSGWSKCS